MHRRESTKSSLNNGADITFKDIDGRTAVQNIFRTIAYVDWHNSLFQEYAKNLDLILEEHVKLNNSSNPSDQNGVTHFHAACVTNNTRVVEFFIKNGVDVDQALKWDSSYFAGFTPLHLAVEYACLDVTEELLKHGANVHAKNSAGLSPMHAIIKRKLAECKNNESSLKCEKIIKYDTILKIFVNFALHNSDNAETVDDYGFCILHAACILQDESVVETVLDKVKNVNQSVNFDSPIYSGYNALHFAAFSKVQVFRMLLKSGANIEAKNARGETPLDLCLQNYTAEDVYSILISKAEYRSIVLSDNETKLVQVVLDMRNTNHDVSFIDSTIFVPFDSPLWPGYTQLHLAVIFAKGSFGIEKIVDCLERGADVTVKDANGSTAVHLAFYMQKWKVVELLLNHHDKLDNPADKNNLSHFHIACVVGHLKAVEHFLSNGVDVDSKINSTFEYTDTMFATKRVIKPGTTAVEITIDNGYGKIEKMLLEHGAVDIRSKVRVFANDNWWPSFHRPAKDFLINLQVDDFLDRMTEILQNLTENQNPLLTADTISRICFLISSVFDNSKDVNVNPTNDHGISLFHIACSTLNEVMIEKFIQIGVDVNQAIDRSSDVCPGSTPLHLVIRPYRLLNPHSHEFDKSFLRILDLLLGKGANINAPDAIGNTPLHEAMKWTELRLILIERLIRCGADVHATSVKGITPFELFLRKGSSWKEMKLFFELGYHFDMCNPITKESYLGIAFEYDQHLIRAKINENQIVRDVDGSLQIYQANNAGRTALHNLVSVYSTRRYRQNTETLRFEEWPFVETDVETWSITIEELVAQGCDIDQRDNDGKTALHLAVSFNNYLFVSGLLRNGADVNLTDDNGQTIFARYSSTAYLNNCRDHCMRQDANYIRYFLALHVYKLKFVGMNVHEQNEILQIDKEDLMNYEGDIRYGMILDEFSRNKRYYNRFGCFLGQIERTKTMNIGTSLELSLYRFLLRTDMDIVYKNMTKEDRKEVEKFFANYIRKYLFVEIEGLIKLKYRRNIERIQLFERAMISFNLLTEYQLPDLCYRKIFNFLVNEDLKRFISSIN